MPLVVVGFGSFPEHFLRRHQDHFDRPVRDPLLAQVPDPFQDLRHAAQVVSAQDRVSRAGDRPVLMKGRPLPPRGLHRIRVPAEEDRLRAGLPVQEGVNVSRVPSDLRCGSVLLHRESDGLQLPSDHVRDLPLPVARRVDGGQFAEFARDPLPVDHILLPFPAPVHPVCRYL